VYAPASSVVTCSSIGAATHAAEGEEEDADELRSRLCTTGGMCGALSWRARVRSWGVEGMAVLMLVSAALNLNPKP
jgi:hypothetical protein